ncbi:MAG: hypothetical protein ACRD5E_11100 [Nitrososphaeraceae archaeon]
MKPSGGRQLGSHGVEIVYLGIRHGSGIRDERKPKKKNKITIMKNTRTYFV